MGIIVLSILVIIILIVIFSTTFTTKDEVLAMLKLRNVYLYLVCFVSLIMILMGTIFTVQNITDVIFPTNYYEALPPEKTGGLSVEEQENYEQNQKRYEENRNIEGKKNVAKSITVVIVALPAFVYHWRKVEKEKNEIQ